MFLFLRVLRFYFLVGVLNFVFYFFVFGILFLGIVIFFLLFLCEKLFYLGCLKEFEVEYVCYCFFVYCICNILELEIIVR